MAQVKKQTTIKLEYLWTFIEMFHQLLGKNSAQEHLKRCQKNSKTT